MTDPAVAARRYRLLAMLIDCVPLFFVNLALGSLLNPQWFNTTVGDASLSSSGGLLGVLFVNPFQDPYWFSDQVFAAVAGLYFWTCHFRWGQTLGKKLCRIKVVTTDGNPLTSRQSALRAVFYCGVIMIPYVGVPLALADQLMIAGSERRCLHDILAGTVVIKAPRW
ncbi:RDD family protein [Sphaerisporangium album]|uniref:RDD family protein n=2 Tax=Sphaerisporangium album TaxID=509200 RepID=A0A367FBV7_9ACTN|nr:RDD family protein [Sphaerisporangium album]